MFGFVSVSSKVLTGEQRTRYGRVYCGICRQIRLRSSGFARLGLQYDMAFLALLLSSLYEPEETAGKRACGFHPIRPRPWADNPYIQYSADMNVALAYYKFDDDARDEGSRTARFMAKRFSKSLQALEARWPRQCAAIRDCICRLSRLEAEGCSNPDLPAGCFGQLMGELLVYEEDRWAPTLRELGNSLGRFIYLADGVLDYKKDEQKGRYNPFLAQGLGEDRQRWQDYLVITMGRCTRYYEALPLVQDKALLDNILYHGVWARLQAGDRKHKAGGTT